MPHCLGCPPNTTLTYDHCKVYPDIVEVDKLVEYARTLAAAGKIDALEHLRDLRLYLYRGTNDATYFKGSVANVGAVFAPFMRNPMEQILLNNTVPSAHSWPTVHYGEIHRASSISPSQSSSSHPIPLYPPPPPPLPSKQ